MILKDAPVTLGKLHTPSADSESDLELDIEYDPSSLTLEQSVKQLFNIINSVKLPSIERQQINSLQSHISKLLTEPVDLLGKRYSKSAKKSVKKLAILNTTQKEATEVEYELEESDVTPFDCIKTPGKGKVS